MKRILPFEPNPLRKKGLTLMELLIIVGIIAILVGIIWIVVASIMEKARQANCMNNLKQIGLAIAIYRQDYGGSLLIGQQFWKLGLPPDLGTLYYSGYIKNRNIFFCPNKHYSTPILNILSNLVSYIIVNSERSAYLPPPRSFSYWSL
ncbi:MAG: DUF1559 domain-containing protein, partial [Armatimonadota bacterium]|nr:DUF1559 domain-containing protein [Armatimonadota bacterium]